MNLQAPLSISHQVHLLCAVAVTCCARVDADIELGCGLSILQESERGRLAFHQIIWMGVVAHFKSFAAGCEWRRLAHGDKGFYARSHLVDRQIFCIGRYRLRKVCRRTIPALWLTIVLPLHTQTVIDYGSPPSAGGSELPFKNGLVSKAFKLGRLYSSACWADYLQALQRQCVVVEEEQVIPARCIDRHPLIDRGRQNGR